MARTGVHHRRAEGQHIRSGGSTERDDADDCGRSNHRLADERHSADIAAARASFAFTASPDHAIAQDLAGIATVVLPSVPDAELGAPALALVQSVNDVAALTGRQNGCLLPGFHLSRGLDVRSAR